VTPIALPRGLQHLERGALVALVPQRYADAKANLDLIRHAHAATPDELYARIVWEGRI
jgi:hypothetical protein